jgi:O-methyltransferase
MFRIWILDFHEEITYNSVKGNVAELGVYKGEFAKELNSLFTRRSLYLFDTFEGFSTKDIETEKNNKFSGAAQEHFSDTNVSLVLSKMKYPERCIVRKGYFPETTGGIDDTFCFVNIDTDLYLPVLNGLEFFYPKLEKGGYIFVHDFNNDIYKGARQAVIKFCGENNIGYVPLTDSGGTVVITK